MGSSTTAAVVLPCADLIPTLQFFESLGLRLDAIFPADAPHSAELSGHGLRVRLEPGAGAPGVLRLTVADRTEPETLVAPNGTVVELVGPPVVELVGPPVADLVVSRMDGGAWGVGRAGMRYRDLIPSRLGGRFIASHIEITDGGPVPDYVHYHHVRFQMIYCWKGWARLVYEDQGEPFVLAAGDCVLQPPEIRHRVLESSPGMAVIEISTPAEHITAVEHAFDLPTPTLRPEREFGGQRFVRHRAAAAAWAPSPLTGFEQRDTGIGAATGGLADVVVLRPADAQTGPSIAAPAEFLLLFALAGGFSVTVDAAVHHLATGDGMTVPPGTRWALADTSPEAEILCVSLPGQPVAVPALQ